METFDLGAGSLMDRLILGPLLHRCFLLLAFLFSSIINPLSIIFKIEAMRFPAEVFKF